MPRELIEARVFEHGEEHTLLLQVVVEMFDVSLITSSEIDANWLILHKQNEIIVIQNCWIQC